MITAMTQHYKAYMLHMKGGGPFSDWLAGYRARSSYSKTLLALCHRVAEGWWNCTHRKQSYDEYVAFGVQRPAMQIVGAPAGQVNAVTGEILDEDTPLSVDVPAIALWMARAQSQTPEGWRYRHDGD
jgi:hypothetical protein